jgi:hypothetical protein
LKTLREKIQIMEAAERGEKIQWRQDDAANWESEFSPNGPTWAWNYLDYRIAPISKPIPKTTADLPSPAWVHTKWGWNFLGVITDSHLRFYGGVDHFTVSDAIHNGWLLSDKPFGEPISWHKEAA